MPLYLPKAAYQEGDLVVVSRPYRHYKNNSNSHIVVFLGNYTTFRYGSSNYTSPGIKARGSGRLYLNGKVEIENYPANDLPWIWPEDGVDTIEGVVVGSLNVLDWYEIKKYLKLCMRQIWPEFREFLMDHAVDGINAK